MKVQFLPQDAAMLQALESAESFRARHGAEVSENLELARDVVRQSLAFANRVPCDCPWHCYLSICQTSRAVVGSGGFKGNPTTDRSVEIAYFTFPAHEGRGYATATAARLLEIARAAPEVASVLAHTLPEDNASTRILRKLGFQHLGEIDHPEDGRIWRWCLRLD